MSAAVLLAALHGIGAELAADGSELVVKAPADRLAPELVMELRDRKPQVIALLNGETCIHCEGPIDGGARPASPSATAPARTWAATRRPRWPGCSRPGARRWESPEALADPAEVMLRGEVT